MVYNEPGMTCTYGAKSYAVGQPVMGAPGNPYEGLYGRILEIREESDAAAPDRALEIFCAFALPVLPYEVAQLEQRFSALSGKKESLDKLNLDRVKMMPEQILPLDRLQDRERTEIWVLTEDWAIEGDYGSSCDLFVSFEDGRRVMAERLQIEQTRGCIARWEHRSDFVVDAGKHDYTAYLDSDYVVNHYTLALQKHFLLLPAGQSAADFPDAS